MLPQKFKEIQAGISLLVLTQDSFCGENTGLVQHDNSTRSFTAQKENVKMQHVVVISFSHGEVHEKNTRQLSWIKRGEHTGKGEILHD